MILRLFCPKCAREGAKEKVQKKLFGLGIEVPMPVSRLSDDGRYQVRCAARHESTVVVDNVRFELLFEYALNALVDGYPREAVSSFASALERFYEFYWHVFAAINHVPEDQADAAWKSVGKQSERQLGMFVTASLLLTKQCPPLLNPRTEVKFRNDVIHGGYIPTIDEATAFGDVVMKLINDSLDTLRTNQPDVVVAVYKRLSPANKEHIVPKIDTVGTDDDDTTGVINILSAVDVRHPVKAKDDLRSGGVADQFKRVLQDRKPHRLSLMDDADSSMTDRE